MQNITKILDAFYQWLAPMLPETMTSHPVLLGGGFLLAGILVGILGTKLSRYVVTLAFVFGGGILGGIFARLAGVHTAPSVAAGGVVMGIIGNQTHKFWIGVVSAGILTMIAVSLFGYQRIGDELSDYVNINPSPSKVVVTDSQLQANFGTSEVNASQVNQFQRSQWISNARQFLSEQDVNWEKHTQAIGIGVGAVLLLFSIYIVRVSMIVSTSMLGTILLVLGGTIMLSNLSPSTYASVEKNPIVPGMLAGAFLVSAMFTQYRLSREAPALEKNKSEDKKSDKE